MKIGFYLLSMVFFFIIVMILGTDIPICFDENAEFIGWWACVKNVGIIIPIVCFLFLVYVLFFCMFLKHKMRKAPLGPVRIKKVENVNSEIMAFVGTYFMPLMSFDFADHWTYLLVFVLLFVLIGIIYVKSDIYYINPTLLIFGFRVYRISGVFENRSFERTVIVHGQLKPEDEIQYLDIDRNTAYVKKKLL